MAAPRGNIDFHQKFQASYRSFHMPADPAQQEITVEYGRLSRLKWQ